MARVGGIAALLASAAFVQVRARSGTFRRAGRLFGPEYTIIETGDLSEEAALAIVNEPELEVGASKDGEEYFPVEPIDPPEHPTLADTDAPAPSGELEIEAPEALVLAVSDVLDRFAPDMERGPVGDESLMDAQVRQLELLVTHETPCDKRIGSLESELTSTKSSLEAANNANAQLREQLAGVETKVKELEAAAAGSGDGEPDVEPKPEDKSGKAKGGSKS